ncbi:MAG: hypothetical protein PHZ11_06465 [Desulfitobacteriaceae bacterium]|nr:hypothetical protein [Desulfitobacteriaceae bacterium]MDD4402064.1 hypothetical protein [Desulfitobacteriaceae bacterium]
METTDKELYSVLLDIIKQESSPEVVEARNLMLRRIAMAGDINPSRIPAPQNITQIGGYINLLESIKQEDLRNRMLASVLGVAMPVEVNDFRENGPELFFARRASDRPECVQADTLPLAFYMRNDFLEAFTGVLASLHAVGASLPVYLTSAPLLPPLSSRLPSQEDILAFLGRILELAPTAAFINPEQDPLIVADEDGNAIVYARSGNVQETTVVKAYVREGGGYVLKEVSTNLIPITPMMQAAGWYMDKRNSEDQSKPDDPALALRWRNITGLVPGRSAFASELKLLYTQAQIIGSCLRDMLSALWDGEKFA